MFRPWIFVGFTGNRTLTNPERVAQRLREALARIEAHTGHPLAAVSSAAKGADTLFVEAALQRPDPLPWILLLPFSESEFFNEDDFSPDDLARIRPFVSRASRVHVEASDDTHSPLERDHAFADCSARTVDESDVLIAVWDGQPGKTGGTGGAIAYARELKKPLLWIHSLTGEIQEENFSGLAHQPAPAPATPAPVATPAGGLATLQVTLAHFDSEALKHGPLAQTIVRDIIFLHLAATAAGLIEPVFALVGFLALLPKTIKLIVLIYASRRAHTQHDLKHGWLHSRIVAELCRAAIATWPLPYSDRTHIPIALPGFRSWQRSLCLWKLLSGPHELPVSTARDTYLKNRFDDPATGQIPYFEKQLARSLARQRRWQSIALWSSRAAIACAILGICLLAGGFVFGTPTPAPVYWLKKTIGFLGLSLPLLASAAFTYLMASDCNRRVERNQAMLAHLRSARERIRTANTRAGLERHVAETESTILLEILEWHSITHFTSSAH